MKEKLLWYKLVIKTDKRQVSKKIDDPNLVKILGSMLVGLLEQADEEAKKK